MSEPHDSLHLPKIQRERDLYLRLLQLGRRQDLAPLLKEALALIVALAEAHQGILGAAR